MEALIVCVLLIIGFLLCKKKNEMATSSNIGYLTNDKEVKSVYCHYDGYPEGVGKTLIKHYNSFDKAKQLISLGGISSLGKTIGEEHDFNIVSDEIEKLGWTTFYHRDRGEPLTITTYKSVLEYMADAGYIDYLYLWCSPSEFQKSIRQQELEEKGSFGGLAEMSEWINFKIKEIKTTRDAMGQFPSGKGWYVLDLNALFPSFELVELELIK